MFFPTIGQLIRQELENLLKGSFSKVSRLLSEPGQHRKPGMADVKVIAVPAPAQALAADRDLQYLQTLLEKQVPDFKDELYKLGYIGPISLAELFVKVKGHPYPEHDPLTRKQWWAAYHEEFVEACEKNDISSWREIFSFLNLHIESFNSQPTVAG